MAAYIRKVRTASGATAVQIAEKAGGRHKILEHLGSAHTDGELAALLQTAREKLQAGQQELDLDLGGAGERGSVIVSKRSRWLIEAISAAWQRLGFDVIDDEAFFQLVVGRLVEPTSTTDTSRVVGEIGMTPVFGSSRTVTASRGWRWSSPLTPACSPPATSSLSTRPG